MPTIDLSRRQVLRGAFGLSLGLPLFYPRAASAQGGVPKRLLLYFVCEGVERKYWFPVPGPSRAPNDFTLDGTCLASLAPYKDRMTVLKGINTESTKPFNACYHGFCMPHILTGGPASAPLSHNGASLPGGISVDRLIARFVQGNAPVASYELGVRTADGDARSRQITALSFDSTGAARMPQRSPYKAFTTLLAGGGNASPELTRAAEETHRRRMSVLDALKGDVAGLRCRLGADGRDKLDAHLTSVRSIEQQVVALYERRQTSSGTLNVPVESDAWYKDINKTPDLMKLQAELARALLMSDTSRVVMIQHGHTVSRWTFPFIPGLSPTVRSADHHDKMSHKEGAVKSYAVTTDFVTEESRKIYTWFAEQFRSTLDLLDAVSEPNGKLLDNTAVVYFSEMGYGNTHDKLNIPIIVAGGAQRALKMGSYVDLNARYKGLYGRANDTGRSMNDLWLTLCHAFGIKLDRFGEANFSKGTIPELLA